MLLISELNLCIGLSLIRSLDGIPWCAFLACWIVFLEPYQALTDPNRPY